MRLLVRGYAVTMVAVLVAVATLGYYLAGRALSPDSQTPRLNTVPRGVATISEASGSLQIKVYRVSNPRQYYFAHQQLLDDEGIWYSFSQPLDQGWSGQGLEGMVSVAFMDSQGYILKILEVEPCIEKYITQTKPCPLYQPGVVYSKALEVSEGWFRQNNVHIGNQVTVGPFFTR